MKKHLHLRMQAIGSVHAWVLCCARGILPAAAACGEELFELQSTRKAHQKHRTALFAASRAFYNSY